MTAAVGDGSEEEEEEAEETEETEETIEDDEPDDEDESHEELTDTFVPNLALMLRKQPSPKQKKTAKKVNTQKKRHKHEAMKQNITDFFFKIGFRGTRPRVDVPDGDVGEDRGKDVGESCTTPTET